VAKYRIILIGVASILAVAACFSAKLFAAELDPEHPEWLFEERNDAEGWGNQTAMTIIGVEDGVLKLETTGADPYIDRPCGACLGCPAAISERRC